MIDRALGIAGLGLGVISIVILTVFPVIKKWIAWTGLSIGLILFGVAGVIFFLPEGEAKAPSPAIKGNCNAIGNGNSSCNNSTN